MIAIGWLYRDGRGVVQDYAEAMKWLQAAAAVGDSWAMYDIALLHPCLNGQGVAGSNKAMKWYQKAAAAGSSMAMNTIGGLYRDGNGVAQDYPAAMKWFRQAAAIGNPTAQTNVGK
jgi:TPR repeat protein